MPRLPIDAPRRRVIKTFQSLGLRVVRDAEQAVRTKRSSSVRVTVVVTPAIEPASMR